MTIEFKRATMAQSRLRMAIMGPSGSGKTLSSLLIAKGLALGKIALIDTERGSASKYASMADFDVVELATFEAERYIEAIVAAGAAGYGVLIIDSLSHAWAGRGGVLEFVDHEAARAAQRSGSQSPNKFAAWAGGTQRQNALVDTILASPCHVIATMRSKMEYAQVEEGGRKLIRKMGMAPVQRDGVEYEFDVVAEMDDRNVMSITKSRALGLQGLIIERPGEALARDISEWLTTGDSPPPELPGVAPLPVPKAPRAKGAPEPMTVFWTGVRELRLTPQAVADEYGGNIAEATDDEREALLGRLRAKFGGAA